MSVFVCTHTHWQNKVGLSEETFEANRSRHRNECHGHIGEELRDLPRQSSQMGCVSEVFEDHPGGQSGPSRMIERESSKR
jgi:hypothetical protein